MPYKDHAKRNEAKRKSAKKVKETIQMIEIQKVLLGNNLLLQEEFLKFDGNNEEFKDLKNRLKESYLEVIIYLFEVHNKKMNIDDINKRFKLDIKWDDVKKKKKQIDNCDPLEDEKNKEIDKYEEELEKDIRTLMDKYDYFNEDEEKINNFGETLKDIRPRLKKALMYDVIHKKLAYEENITFNMYNVLYNMDITQDEMDEMVKNGQIKY